MLKEEEMIDTEAPPEDVVAKLATIPHLPGSLKAILMHAKRWDLTGSRAILPEEETLGRDWDFIVLVNPGSNFGPAAEANDFVFTGHQYDNNTKGFDEETARWEGPHIDLITFEDNEAGQAAYERWLTATKVCRELGLKERKHRVMVFRAIRTGKWFPPEEKGAEAPPFNDEIPF
jgi:hypothetical protein